MEVAAKKCKVRGCPWFIRDDVHHKNCTQAHVDLAKAGKQRTHSQRLHDDRRGSSASRGYGYRWQKVRIGFLKSHPTCEFCKVNGFSRAATLVDHIKPYSSVDKVTGLKVYDKVLQWEHDNWQGLCDHHHNVDKQRIEYAWRKGELGDEALKGIGVRVSDPPPIVRKS